MPAIELRGIGKKYRTYSNRREQLKDLLRFGKSSEDHDFWALQDVDLQVEPGATVGILGRNGAGKSTLLKVICGVVEPTTGTLEINGRLAAIFGLGAGFNPEFTGRDNVMLNGLLLGIDRDEMLERFEDIENFADIGPFMDQPVKTYSSGMRARLGFAVAVNVEPDILVVDETLSVGDAVFKQAGLQRMHDLRDRGTTILFVSHSMGMVKNFCDQALLLHKGQLITHGDIDSTLEQYQALLNRARAKRRMPDAEASMAHMIEHEEAEDFESPSFKKDQGMRKGRARAMKQVSGGAKVRSVELLDADHRPTHAVDPEAATTVRVHVEYLQDVRESLVSVLFRTEAGLDVFATDTAREGAPLGERRTGERVILDFAVNLPLRPGHYDVSAGVSRLDEDHLDWIDAAKTFEIQESGEGPAAGGLVRLPTTVEVHDSGSERSNRSA